MELNAREKAKTSFLKNNYMNETISSFKIRSENVGKLHVCPLITSLVRGKEGLFSEGYGHKHKMTLQS